MSGIKYDEWLLELNRLKEKMAETPEGMTVREMQSALGKSYSWVMKKIQAGVELGMCVCNGRKGVPRVDGQICNVPVYKFIFPNNKKFAKAK